MLIIGTHILMLECFIILLESVLRVNYQKNKVSLALTSKFCYVVSTNIPLRKSMKYLNSSFSREKFLNIVKNRIILISSINKL